MSGLLSSVEKKLNVVQCNSYSGNSTITHLHVIVCSLFQKHQEIRLSQRHFNVTYVYMYEMNVYLMVGMVTQGGENHV